MQQPLTQEQLIQRYPLLKKLIQYQECAWFNPNSCSVQQALPYIGLNQRDIEEASERLQRFAPYLMAAFPETEPTQGIIESELVDIANMRTVLEQTESVSIPNLLLKKDSHLAIAGSIKARGGIYEVLTHAEKLAINNGLLNTSDDYSKLHSDTFKEFFSQYRIAVGSTGNLGLSIGIISAKLGFSVSVHMSADAKSWKKDLLRQHGATVIEYRSDYGVAVEQGRKESLSDPHCFFIDDENSTTLFLGYAVAGQRLKQQLATQGITADKSHPLFVYLPCGVGGAPGGVAFGLKMALGDHVHCIFAEPTHSPCMLLGVHTGLHDAIAVQDIGIDNQTAADGLAVGRASGFVGRAMERLIDGYYTVSDERLYRYLQALSEQENIQLEPSALAAMHGPVVLTGSSSDVLQYQKQFGLDATTMKNATHLVWATGGGMVPKEEMASYLNR
ncbi:D-serine ammonia-lyase [Reinekea thalattae]|uniref:Probable D-serine dehydratase n=1 Tax=Reinekea thalattae TaxID=2593301 RepID=A0A5C8ZBP3_9GAMM|nr:D-serine ammonia-lyase [Reinekea thalattae]TXR54316.1 D-serine ammonia-lyase [Reinekea thalattae]